MKKIILIIACIALTASIAAAQTDVVYSVNVVGFQKVNAIPGSQLVMGGMPFDPANPDIHSVIATQLTAGSVYAAADKVITWDADDQEYKKYFFRAGGRSGPQYKWVSSTNELAVATDALIGDSKGFWIITGSAAVGTQEVVLVGDVINDKAVTNDIRQGLNLVGYSYSSPIDINATKLTNGTAGSVYAAGDKIIVWDAQEQQYKKFFYRAGGRSGPQYKWVSSTDELSVASFTIQPGQGFWYSALTNFSWIETRPYTLD